MFLLKEFSGRSPKTGVSFPGGGNHQGDESEGGGREERWVGREGRGRER